MVDKSTRENTGKLQRDSNIGDAVRVIQYRPNKMAVHSAAFVGRLVVYFQGDVQWETRHIIDSSLPRASLIRASRRHTATYDAPLRLRYFYSPTLHFRFFHAQTNDDVVLLIVVATAAWTLMWERVMPTHQHRILFENACDTGYVTVRQQVQLRSKTSGELLNNFAFKVTITLTVPIKSSNTVILN